MKTTRIIANVLAGLVLAIMLFGLVAVIIDERASKAESAASPKRYVQEIPFGTGNQ